MFSSHCICSRCMYCLNFAPKWSVVKFVHVFIFVRCVAVRCVFAALVGGGDKPPCATGRIRYRAFIVAREWLLFHVFKFCRLCSPVKVKVMLSVPQSSLISSVFQFCVVALRSFIFIVVFGGQSLRGKCRRHRFAHVFLSSSCAHRNSFLLVFVKFTFCYILRFVAVFVGDCDSVVARTRLWHFCFV
jgi:hypothetical protein